MIQGIQILYYLKEIEIVQITRLSFIVSLKRHKVQLYTDCGTGSRTRHLKYFPFPLCPSEGLKISSAFKVVA